MTEKEPIPGAALPADAGATADAAAAGPHPPHVAAEDAAPATDDGSAEHAADEAGVETEAARSSGGADAAPADGSADAAVDAPVPEAGSDPHAAEGADAASLDGPPADAPTVAGDVAAEPGEEDASAAKSDAVAGGPLRSERIRLTGESGGDLTLGVRTVLGKHMVRQFGADHNVWDAEQCVLERGEEGIWQISPREGTTNETLLNSEALSGPRPLHDGDVIAVGRAAKGIARLPLTVGPA